MRPRVILFDEPTTGLDPIRSAGIDDLIVRLREKFNVTNIVVTHDLASAKHVADRVVMLLGGKVAADGPFDNLARSEDARIQHFLTGTYCAEDEPGMAETEKSSLRVEEDAANPRMFKRGKAARTTQEKSES